MSQFKKLSANLKQFGEAKKIMAAAIVALLLSGLAFQNCSVPATSTANSLTSIGAKMNFPYDSQIDQIAYMSCNQMALGSYDASAYFGFRVGAYRTGSGVEITTAFMKDKHVSGGSISDQSALLSHVAAVVGAHPQLAVRSFSNFQIPFLSTAGGSGTEGRDFTTFFTPMDDPNFAIAVLTSAAGDGVKYARTDTPEGARFEGTIALNNSWASVTGLQQSINSGAAILAVTYQGQSGTYQARAPSDYGLSANPSGTSAFGRGYQIQFRQPVGSSGGYPINTLASVTEISLETRGLPSTSSTWTCDPSLQFRILRSNLNADLSQAGCNIGVDNPSDPKLAIVRNSFRVEDWYVDMVNRCLIPKKAGAGCYAQNVGIPANTPPTMAGGNTYPNDFLTYNIASPAYPPGQNNNLFVEFGSICFR